MLIIWIEILAKAFGPFDEEVSLDQDKRETALNHVKVVS